MFRFFSKRHAHDDSHGETATAQDSRDLVGLLNEARTEQDMRRATSLARMRASARSGSR